jgi:hypothetical protein
MTSPAPARVLKSETLTLGDGATYIVDLCPDCGGLPVGASALFREPDQQRFCSCPFDDGHP